MVRVSDELHKAVRIKAAKLGISISEVVRRLLYSWATGAIALPDSPEEVISNNE